MYILWLSWIHSEDNFYRVGIIFPAECAARQAGEEPATDAAQAESIDELTLDDLDDNQLPGIRLVREPQFVKVPAELMKDLEIHVCTHPEALVPMVICLIELPLRTA